MKINIEEAAQIVAEKAIQELRDNGIFISRWIPVSERLPEDMQRVLIWFEYYRYGDFNRMYQTYGFGYVCDGEWSPFINGETGWKDARIIAWMPLPEPYKAESKLDGNPIDTDKAVEHYDGTLEVLKGIELEDKS